VLRLHRLSERCCLSNLASVPTDCPSRERQGWLGDAGIGLSLAHCTQFDMRLFYEKWFNDISDMQESSGFIPYICPFRTYGLYGMDIPWSTGAVVAAWESYQAYGDKTFLSQFHPLLKKWADFVCALPLKDGLSSGHTRWNDHMAESHYSLDFLENAYAFRTLDLFSKIADTLGESQSAALYRERADSRRDAINRRYMRDDVYDSKNIQGSNAHALYLGLVPETHRSAVLSKMVENLEQEKHFTTGILGTVSLILALAENGGNDLIYKLVKSDAPRTWGYWLTHYAATTAMESWVHDPCSQGSTHNHPMLIGGLVAWLYRELAGIKPLEPGYKRVKINPFVPHDMKQASAVIHSVHGPVKSAWKQEAQQFSMEVEIPANTTAEIHVPNPAGAVVYEGREDARHAVGVVGFREEKGVTVLQVGSGTYAFHLKT
jgi:alpha-L-rhamnosidase